MNTLILKWSEGEVPVLNGIMESGGRLHLVRATDPPRCLPMSLQLEKELDLAYLFETDWTIAITSNRACDPISGMTAVCGECGMGSDGFVAVQASEEPASLLWLAFFDFSNPFDSVRFEEGFLKATNNLLEEWSFSLTNPWQVKIRDISGTVPR